MSQYKPLRAWKFGNLSVEETAEPETVQIAIEGPEVERAVAFLSKAMFESLADLARITGHGDYVRYADKPVGGEL